MGKLCKSRNGGGLVWWDCFWIYLNHLNMQSRRRAWSQGEQHPDDPQHPDDASRKWSPTPHAGAPFCWRSWEDSYISMAWKGSHRPPCELQREAAKAENLTTSACLCECNEPQHLKPEALLPFRTGSGVERQLLKNRQEIDKTQVGMVFMSQFPAARAFLVQVVKNLSIGWAQGFVFLYAEEGVWHSHLLRNLGRIHKLSLLPCQFCSSCCLLLSYSWLVGGLEHFWFFHLLGISSSQVTNSMIFQRGGSTNHQPVGLIKQQTYCNWGARCRIHWWFYPYKGSPTAIFLGEKNPWKQG